MRFFNLNAADNMQRVRPWLGILLICSIALMVGRIAVTSIQNLTDDLNNTLPKGVEGTISLVEKDAVHRGDLIHFYTDVFGDMPRSARTYVTVTCMQDDRVVYGRAASEGDVFLLDGGNGSTEVWNTGPALCSAALMYSIASTSIQTVFMVDSTSFVVRY